MRCNYESPAGIYGYDGFARNYESMRDAAFFVIGGHPAKWGDAGFEEFRRIPELLLSDGCHFLTPGGYTATQN